MTYNVFRIRVDSRNDDYDNPRIERVPFPSGWRACLFDIRGTWSVSVGGICRAGGLGQRPSGLKFSNVDLGQLVGVSQDMDLLPCTGDFLARGTEDKIILPQGSIQAKKDGYITFFMNDVSGTYGDNMGVLEVGVVIFR